MFKIAAILAVSLSLTQPGDYTYTTPFCSSSQIKGVGMGANADYTMLRAEDVAFLREAYTERTDVDFAFTRDQTNAIDRLIPIRPHTGSTGVFDDYDWGGCFSLSYTTNDMPYGTGDAYAGSFVRPGFSFNTSVQFEEVPAFPASAEDEFRTISSDAIGNYTFATNEIPPVWWKEPYVMTTNRICSLYAGLPLFNVAAMEVTTWNKANRTTVYDDYSYTCQVAEYHQGESGYEVDGQERTTYYHSGYKSFSSSDTNTEYRTSGNWNLGLSEFRRMYMYNEYDIMMNSQDVGTNLYPIVVLGSYKSSDYRRTFKSVSNCYVWVESPVATNVQDDIQISQTVLDVHLMYTVSQRRQWTNPSLTNDADRIETTNFTKRAVMYLPMSATLDKSVGLNWNGTRWFYKMVVPMDYIHNRAEALFGDLDGYWPEPARVEDDEIASEGRSGGSAVGDTYVSISMAFSGSRAYMVYSRTYKARTL